jgi:hypothetical protein
MKILFDVNMPHPLRRELPGHEVVTAQFQGWAELESSLRDNRRRIDGHDCVLAQSHA